MASRVTVNIKSTIGRDWLDVEPKVYAALVSGTAVAGVLIILRLLHVPVDPAVQTLLPELAGVLAGYAKASTHRGDLLRKVQHDGLGDLVELAPEVADAVPALAPAADGITELFTELNGTPTTTAAPAVASE